MAAEVSFAAFLLLALNEKKLRVLTAGRLGSIQPILLPADKALAQSITEMADAFQQIHEQILLSKGEAVEIAFPHPNLELTQLRESDAVGPSCGLFTGPCETASNGFPI